MARISTAEDFEDDGQTSVLRKYNLAGKIWLKLSCGPSGEGSLLLVVSNDSGWL